MNPKDSQQLTMATVEVFLAIEDQILMNIANHLKRHNSLFIEEGIYAWQTLQLQELGSLTQQNILAIAKHSGMAVDEVSKLLDEVGYSTIKDVDQALEEAVRLGLIVRPDTTPTISFSGILAAYQSQAIDNFNLINTTMLDQSQQKYINILNQTVGKVLTGTMTPQQALRAAAKELAEKGIPALIDRAGREWSTEAYLNTVIKSMTNNVANEMQFSRMDEYGVDLLEVSSHMGARPRCAPYQGRIYSRSGDSEKYPALSSTSYGEIAGLKGIHCGHIFYPFVEGISIKRNHPYNIEDNDKAYQLSQKQRYLERQIRYAKRELNMLSVMGDDEGIELAKNKISQRQLNMREFIDDTGRTRRRHSEQLAINNPIIGGKV